MFSIQKPYLDNTKFWWPLMQSVSNILNLSYFYSSIPGFHLLMKPCNNLFLVLTHGKSLLKPEVLFVNLNISFENIFEVYMYSSTLELHTLNHLKRYTRQIKNKLNKNHLKDFSAFSSEIMVWSNDLPHWADKCYDLIHCGLKGLLMTSQHFS